MKPTQEQVIAWAREVCMPFYYQTGEIAGLERLEQFAALAYEAGRKDENAEVTQELLKMAETDNLTNYFKVAAVRVQARREQ